MESYLLLQKSFIRILPKKEQFARAFYQNLFTHYPQVRPLFAYTDMNFQQSKLLAALTLVINNLKNVESLKPTLIELGQHHVQYHVKPEHYTMVKDTLLLTLGEFLEAMWTEELQIAWATSFDAVVQLMCEASQSLV